MQRTVAWIVPLCVVLQLTTGSVANAQSNSVSNAVSIETTLLELDWSPPRGMGKLRWNGKLWSVDFGAIARAEARGVSLALIGPGRPMVLTVTPPAEGAGTLRVLKITVDGRSFDLN